MENTYEFGGRNRLRGRNGIVGHGCADSYSTGFYDPDGGRNRIEHRRKNVVLPKGYMPDEGNSAALGLLEMPRRPIDDGKDVDKPKWDCSIPNYVHPRFNQAVTT